MAKLFLILFLKKIFSKTKILDNSKAIQESGIPVKAI